MSVANVAGGLSYLEVFRATPFERIRLVREGVDAAQAKRLLADLSLGQGIGLRALNLSTATINRKAKGGQALSPEESERVIGAAKLVGQVEAMVRESGEIDGFDAPAWMARWLTEPLPALGGTRPIELMDTMEGQGVVANALAKLQGGAYA